MVYENIPQQPPVNKENVESQKKFDLNYFQEIVNQGKLNRDEYLKALNQALELGILVEDKLGEEHDQELRQNRASFIFFVDPQEGEKRYMLYNKNQHTSFNYKIYKTLAGPFMKAMLEHEKIKKEKAIKQQKEFEEKAIKDRERKQEEFEAKLVKKPLGEEAKDWQDQLKEAQKKMAQNQDQAPTENLNLANKDAGENI